MVDWSGADRRRSGKPDTIWIAHGASVAAAPLTHSTASRTEAETFIRSELLSFLKTHAGRALVSFDFAYGYPAGFAELLPELIDMPPWRKTWEYLADALQDDIGTAPGRNPSNRSNRFEVANALNCLATSKLGPGPFWCLYSPGSQPHVPQRQPRQPFTVGPRSIAPLRITDRRANAGTVFRIFGTGSVGSQALTGIPRVRKLRFDPELADMSVLWPFETAWAATPEWPGAARVVHAEIYPSVRPPLKDEIHDRGQVRAMWEWARANDTEDGLMDFFRIPDDLTPTSIEDEQIRTEEGWILGVR